MAIPSEKSSELTDILEAMFGRTTAIKSDTCSFCGFPAKIFRDKVSKTEYATSGLCQDCQDSVFGGINDDTNLE